MLITFGIAFHVANLLSHLFVSELSYSPELPDPGFQDVPSLHQDCYEYAKGEAESGDFIIVVDKWHGCSTLEVKDKALTRHELV